MKGDLMSLPTLQELLEAGAHFGHDPSRWNPKMAQFIFGTRNRVHIIDLQQTVVALERAVTAIRQMAVLEKTLLFVGTKRQARAVVKREAERCGMPYVTTRWLGGTLTNFPTILKSIEKRTLLEQQLSSPEAARMTKKDRQKMAKELERLTTVLEGLKAIRAIPDAVILIGAHDEQLAAKEALRMGIPVSALVDTNANPERIEYPIPGNDDAVRSIALITKTLADAILEGRTLLAQQAPPTHAAAPADLLTPSPVPASPVPAGETSGIV